MVQRKKEWVKRKNERANELHLLLLLPPLPLLVLFLPLAVQQRGLQAAEAVDGPHLPEEVAHQEGKRVALLVAD